MVQRHKELADEAFEAVRRELSAATSKHGAFHSAHEGYAVILEELDELFEEVRANDHQRAIEEATQVAAMAVRFMIDIAMNEDSRVAQ